MNGRAASLRTECSPARCAVCCASMGFSAAPERLPEKVSLLGESSQIGDEAEVPAISSDMFDNTVWHPRYELLENRKSRLRKRLHRHDLTARLSLPSSA